MSIKNSKTKNLLIKQINELTASEQTTLYKFLEKDFGLLRQQADDIARVDADFIGVQTQRVNCSNFWMVIIPSRLKLIIKPIFDTRW